LKYKVANAFFVTFTQLFKYEFMAYKKASDVRKENALLKAEIAMTKNILDNDPGYIFRNVAENINGEWLVRNTYCNRTVLEALGYTREKIDATGHDFARQIVHKDDYPLLHEKLRKLCCEENVGKPDVVVCRCKNKDNSYNWVIGNCMIINYTKGQTQWEMVCSVNPVTRETLKDPKMLDLMKDYKRLICKLSKDKLTSCELKVLKLLATGESVKRIETLLKIKESTIKFHKYNMIHKLGLPNALALVTWAHECWIV